MNVFFDTNVLIDVIAARKPFVADSRKVWYLAERQRISGQVSVLSFANIYYVIRKQNGRAVAESAMTMIRGTFAAVAFDEQILNQAIGAGFSDFEDAIQLFSALRAEADCLLTRNADHFPTSSLPVMTPGEFLAAHSFDTCRSPRSG